MCLVITVIENSKALNNFFVVKYLKVIWAAGCLSDMYLECFLHFFLDGQMAESEPL